MHQIDVSQSGAVVLGPNVVCDGFIHSAALRVQTHVHSDHMKGFESSKGLQRILMSEATHRLLVTEFDADLPYRTNIQPLGHAVKYALENSKIELLPSGHMLGAVQVAVELDDGTRVGYSSDFNWPIDQVMAVDGLVVDSTYGSPLSRRNYTQGRCEDQFASLLRELLAKGPVVVKAHRGTLHRALQVMTGEIDCPVVASEKLRKEIQVYRDFGYSIGEIKTCSPRIGTQKSGDDVYVRVIGRGESPPVDIEEHAKITLSAYFTDADDPLTQYSPRAYAVAMSDHADFNGTLSYIEATGAEFVVTDNTRGGHAVQLAEAIRDRLGIEARPSSNRPRGNWGS